MISLENTKDIAMKELTTSIYTFENLIQGNFLYVDKTEYIWQLVKPAKEMYFLSRPRRFGKSLTLSTLKAVFEGKKELFKGLAIYDKPYDWQPYPVVHLSFGDYTPLNDTAEKLNRDFLRKIKEVANDLKVTLTVDDDAFLDIMIPRMLLQPIVENSIIHGFTDRAGKVTVSATVDEKDVFITVEDNGSGMKESELSELKQKLKDCHSGANEGISRVALINIERRITYLRFCKGVRNNIYLFRHE